MSPVSGNKLCLAFSIVCTAGLFLTASVRAADTGIEALATHLRQQDNAAAWGLAQRLAPSHLGETDFDYLYGLAALEANVPQHAIFAFERVLLAQPENHRARLELGRAYYVSGNDRAARAAFEYVLSTDPPVGVRSTIEQFLLAIDRREASARTRLSGYADVRLGFDSNVASATSDEQIRVPALGIVTLSDAGQATSDRFLEKNAGLRVLHPFSKRYALLAEFNFKDRENFSTNDGDIRVAGFSAGPVFGFDKNRLRIPVQVQSLYLDNDSYRRIGAAGLEWTRQLDADNELLLTGEYGSLRYPGQGTRNARLALIGAVWTQRLPIQRLELNAGVFYGDERNQDSAADYNGKDYVGVRFGAQWKPHTQHTYYAVLTAQTTGHDANDPVFGVVRDEDYLELRLGWDHALTRDWSVRAELSAARNDANIALYEYNREQVFVGLRYAFE